MRLSPPSTADKMQAPLDRAQSNGRDFLVRGATRDALSFDATHPDPSKREVIPGQSARPAQIQARVSGDVKAGVVKRADKLCLIVALSALASSTLVANAKPPSKSAMLAVETLETKFQQLTIKTGENWGPEFMAASKEVADTYGPPILHAVMHHLWRRKWSGEEPLIFVPLVGYLPRKETIAILKKYRRSSRGFDALYAREFLTEIEMADHGDGLGPREK